MENWNNRFLADLTTSEGRLRRFTQICHVLRPKGKLRGDRLVELVRERRLGLRNIKVIRRHIRVMEVFNLIDSEDGLYSISSEGRALSALTSNEPGKVLSLTEKILYLRFLAVSVPIQLTSLLVGVSENSERSKESVVISYGRKLLSYPIPWKDREAIRFQLSKESPSIPRKLQNNFDCLLLWLKQLDLVDSQRLAISKLGMELSEAAASQDIDCLEMAYRVACAYVCGEPGCLHKFNYHDKSQREHFLKVFNEAYTLFEMPEISASDVVSMRLYLCIKLMTNRRILLDEPGFDQVIKVLSQEGIIRAAMTGRGGRLAYISVGAGVR